MYHVVYSLPHCSVPLFPPLRLLVALQPLLRAERLSLASVVHLRLVLEVFLLVVVEVLLDVGRDLGQVLELLLDLPVDLVKVVEFHQDLVDLDLGPECGARVPALDGWTEAPAIAVAAVYRGANAALASLCGLLIRH